MEAFGAYLEKLHSPQIILPLFLWSAVWSGMALWRSSRNNQKYWFIFFLFIHTAGIIELTYLKFFAKKTK